MKNYDNLFHKEYRESQKLDEKIAAWLYETKYDVLLSYLKEIGASWLYLEDYQNLYVIDKFTKNEEIKEMLAAIANQDDVQETALIHDKKWNLPRLIIKKEQLSIEVLPFSKLNANIKKNFPDIETNKREGTCFDKAYNISQDLDVTNQIVTGFVYGYTDKSKFLHSWIETKIKKEEVVIDGTLTAIFNKQGYYNIRHAEVLNRISNETVRNDVKNYLEQIQNIPQEFYFVFRDAIIKDLERNNQLFKSKVKK
ncbi:MAG: hypothetical protein HFE81_02850 [Bacilli bacterium]|nr:hypothetical protein [Bacilli bacterium]